MRTTPTMRALHYILVCSLYLLSILSIATAEQISPLYGNGATVSTHPSPFTRMKQTPRELLSFRTADDGLQCADVLKAEDQCAFVRTYCADDKVGFFDYLELYYCTLSDVKPIAFIIITIGLITVFTTIGITASDFLCPNLGTISNLLGMSESLAGVTFLALGNGSPDVFSTYAAMKAGSGSLAVGELIGAASFITSVVAGSMAIICPFTVDYGSFSRDLVFFTIAVAFAMYCLQDGHIARWECIAMVALYITYVGFVMLWHWYLTRVDRMRASFAPQLHHTSTSSSTDSDRPQSYYSDVVNSAGLSMDDSESAPLLSTVSRTPSSIDIERAVDRYQLRSLQEGRYGEITQAMKLQRPWNSNHSGYGYGESPNIATSAPIRPSLIGALELRSAVHRGRAKPDALDNEARYRHGRSASQGLLGINTKELYRHRSRDRHYQHRHTQSQTVRHAHRFSVDRTLEYGPNAVARLQRQENVHAHKFRSHSAAEVEDPAYYSEGSRTQSRASTRSPPFDPGMSSSRVPNLRLPDGIISPPLRSPSIASQSTHNTLYPLRQQSLLRTTGRDRSNSNQTLRSITETLSPQDRIGRKQHVRNKSSLGRPPRSPSPYDRFLAFQPALIPVPSEVPLGASTLADDDLISFDDDSTRSLNETLSPISPGTLQHLELPGHVDESYSEISDLDSSNSMISSAGWWCCIPRPYDLKKTLLPTIDRLHEKTALNKFVSILAVPSVFILTITIPVIEVERLDPELIPCDVPELHIESEVGTDRNDSTIAGEGQDDDSFVIGEVRYKGWNKWLACVQCLCAPTGVLIVNWYDDENLLRHSMMVMLGSLIGLSGVVYFTDTHKAPGKLLPIMCFIGFVVSISWISAVAVEAVGILKAYGVIFGISDAILGLTVFALGNSLGDYVSNITVAKMGYPMMAISACFGSPMLNILIGIGVSGIILLPHGDNSSDTDAYDLEIAPSLIISAATLFLNLLLFLTCVPLNSWRMTRIIGIASVSIWIIGTAINVALEVKGGIA